jgi:EAL domain-containing protein (putative c-di-GMP-specific phosphodiesterase class I)
MALTHCQLVLHYQPRFDLKTNRIVAFEALARWQHPERGVISAGAFIPVAERSGLIGHLGTWALREACRQAVVWRSAGRAYGISVNLSPAQTIRQDLVGLVEEALADAGLEPESLELEVTENNFVNLDERPVAKMLKRLTKRGVQFSIDDFGRGYSSLAYLSRIPVGTIKIDQMFVQRIGQTVHDEAIIHAVIDLCHNLGRRVVAEGVETEEQLTFLRAHDCDEAQGFLLGLPVRADEAAGLRF